MAAADELDAHWLREEFGLPQGRVRGAVRKRDAVDAKRVISLNEQHRPKVFIKRGRGRWGGGM